MSRAPTNIDSEEDLYLSIKLACASCSILFLLLGILMFPSGPFIKPHPAFWRLVLSLSIIYLMTLTFCLFLTVEQVQSILTYLFGQNILETESEIAAKEVYATDCNNLSFDKLYMAIDRYALAHYLGWVAKAILLRSYGLCWLISLTWELTEISFTHVIEHLTECWWDSWILDVALCNGLGIHCGIKIAKFLEMSTYKWESIKTKDVVSEKLVRLAIKFSPENWFKIRWINPKSSPNRVLKLWCLTMIFLVTELNAFFFKHFVNYRSSHILCWGRIIFIAIMGAPAVRQYYIYTTDLEAKNLGSQCWLFIAIIVLELLVNIKYGWTHFEKTKITYIIVWMAMAALLCAICLYFMAAWSELTVYMFNDEDMGTGSKSNSPKSSVKKQKSVDKHQQMVTHGKNQVANDRSLSTTYTDSEGPYFPHDKLLNRYPNLSKTEELTEDEQNFVDLNEKVQYLLEKS